MDNFEKNITSILKTDDVPDVNEEYLGKFLNYFQENFDKNVTLTGAEVFRWEEYYIFGPGSKKEYEDKKKKNLSSDDLFSLIGITEDFIDDVDPVIKVRRLTDKKLFYIGLSWVTTKEENNPMHILLEDFSTWVVNY